MFPKTHHAIILAAIAVGVAALLGIAALEGWLPSWPSAMSPASVATPGQLVAGTALADSLLPGETIVTLPEGPKSPVAAPPTAPQPRPALPAAPPAAPQPRPALPAEPARKPAPRTPTYAQSPAPNPAASRPSSTGLCANCGVVSSTTSRGSEWNRGAWEVSVKFDDGSRKVLRYPSDPGWRVGERVFFSSGRLHRD